MLLADYDYPLPPERIAQEPVSPRDSSRLLTLEHGSGKREHRSFRDLPDLLDSKDLLVLNDTRVFRARIFARKPTGGRLEFLFVRHLGGGTWEALCNGMREIREGISIQFPGETARIAKRCEDTVILEFSPSADVPGLLDREGEVPLPPYIHRDKGESRAEGDSSSYQTVFARHRGAVAAPTAGLHFTPELLRCLQEKGVRSTFVTLHVGPGTFLPVRALDARQHRIHSEQFFFPREAAQALAQTRERGGRVVAAGTTVARVLEHVALGSALHEAEGECDLYVLPGHKFRCVDALITNFHLPRSTLLLFVAAFIGRERILEAYREAIERQYRFYSYGDAMFLH
ncbi:MAG: tRNA preQ1(34) S-adenosylmethionine ribosyltransferase-isomerase QueA [Acidobacteria bacterium]|nr:tRNA preQ1(34) S-adenosylmethionine ribosyltransferase-isomerase QueA [Acidobacteriota bacterium]MCI0567214.1 tRNA preQ1(34) S-adenosylmethionine ribosyltransferase-isomerase QueA [Acidobacteriota bacterium]